jgi:hypothetical protein
MIRSCLPRRGAGNPMAVAVIALVIALLGVVLTLCRDPYKSGFGFSNPFGDGLGGYDFDSASGAYKAQLEIEQIRDIRANLALQRKLNGKELKERLDTLKVEKEVDFKKKEKDKSVDYKVLFISYKQKGEDRKEVVTMTKDADAGIWHRQYLSSSDVEKDNKDLAREMRDWDRPEFKMDPRL